jgi:pimeloyl-ACP methyl ester carboxylesterase
MQTKGVRTSPVGGGGRTASAPGFGAIDFNDLPSSTTEEYIPITAEDGGCSRGHLYTRGGEKTVVCFMHPRGDLSRHYAMPGLLAAGFATFGHNSRWLNNDIACVHESLVLDVAAGIGYLKEKRGFERVILAGNSGGGGLYSFYEAQAEAPVGKRLVATPAGDPPNLNEFQLPEADGIILLAAHVGQGAFLMTTIDPAVIDESDPLATDPALDMYFSDNGFRQPPLESRYSTEFLSRYRRAQTARVQRLDAIAHSYIAEQNGFRSMMTDPAFEHQSEQWRRDVSRRASLGRLMRIYRTDANPAYCDLSIDPSPRDIGSLISGRPDLSNYAFGGFAGVLTARAWLSTWSGISSRAGVINNLPFVKKPTLIVYYEGDNAIFPKDIAEMMRVSGASQKEMFPIKGEHYGLSLGERTETSARARANTVMVEWLRERFQT